jgi:serine phosphatase RsbU (regulator of sigma subunit)
MAGRWDSAINYLEASIRQGDSQSRSDLLPATINSIYAAQDLGQAVHFLRRGLAAAFGVSESQVWLSPPQENLLRLVGPAGANIGSQPLGDLQIALNADRLETRAYRQQVPLRGQEGDQRAVRAIPLSIPGRKPIGVITLYDQLLDNLATEMRDRDVQLVGFLNQAARALQTVSARRQELAIAGRMQASLMPLSLPQLPGWQLAATWRPARETSGDFYDLIALPGGLVGLVIADVVDKGMGAALLMALSRTLIRTYADHYPDQPEQLLSIANRRIIADIGGGLFVTLFYGVLDPSTGRLVYCNAGHPPPHMFARLPDQPVESLFRTGIPLGISEDAVWERSAIDIPHGSLLLLYTDGVYEAQNSQGEFFGESGVLSTARRLLGGNAQQVQDGLLSAVLSFTGSEPQLDDIALMVLRREME